MQIHLDRNTRWYLLALLVLVTAGSVACNVQYADMTYNGAVDREFTLGKAAAFPIVLPLAVHAAGMLAGVGGRLRWILAGLVMAIATVSFGISFHGIYGLTLAEGYPLPIAIASPVVLDLFAALLTAALVLDTPADKAETVDSEAPEAIDTVIAEAASTPDAVTVPAAENVCSPVDVDEQPVVAEPITVDAAPAAPTVTPTATPVTPPAPTVPVDSDVQALAEQIAAENVVKASVEDIVAVIAMLAAGESGRAASRATGLHTTTVGLIKKAVEAQANRPAELVAA
ncbi:hypothetical protein PP312_20590 [Mycobacteroides abscessus]|nr:hypothetical protein [Mycobacteroides abscessus]QSM04144.1 helix-turn-helix DNA binding protein and membrane protein [Mycobacterium phage prophiGD51-2]AMU55738.1 hypothetical protein A3O02_11590 [Mycobacteroides abscessus]MBE5436510.1 hypothetical protein [Mycobacteroides abscessus]MDM1962680.1 hypothetical protein [Mycobacteroides abscessus]MDM1967224.1 hypothetical protein [Mycobacteroides abscessus]